MLIGMMMIMRRTLLTAVGAILMAAAPIDDARAVTYRPYYEYRYYQPYYGYYYRPYDGSQGSFYVYPPSGWYRR